MRTLMIVRDYFPKVGGVPTHTRALVHHLTRLGVTVDILAGGTDFRTAVLPLRGRMGVLDYDVVHVQGGPFAGLVSHPHLVVTVHSPILEEGRYYRAGQKMEVPFAYFLERVGLARASAVISVSNQTARELVSSYGINPGKLSVIPNGVDCESFHPVAGRNQGVPQVLICARLEPRKNTRHAIVVLRRLRGIPFHLRVVGDGSERHMLEELAEGIPSKEFLGSVSEEKLGGIFAGSDIFVSTSFSEGFGLTILEAMASGCAVLVSDIPVHREIVKHMENGMVYEDDRDFEDSLKELMTNYELRRRLGESARRTAIGFSWEVAAKKTLSLYKSLVTA